MTKRNLFIDLELPPETTDLATFQAAVAAKRAEWSKLESNPGRGPEARAKRAAIPEFERTFQSESERHAAATEARLALGRRQRAANEALEGRIRALSLHRSYRKADLDRLAKELKEHFTQAQIEARLRQAGLKPEGDRPLPPRIAAGLDPGKAKSIAQGLDILGLKDLYALVGQTNTARTSVLKAAAEALHEKLRHKTDPESTQRRIMLGEAGVVFASDAERAKYDVSLGRAKLQELEPLIDLAARDKVLSAAHFEEMVRDGVKRGATPELAREFVRAHAAKRKFIVQEGDTAALAPPLVCANCRALTEDKGPNADIERTQCPQCGFGLLLQCPRCKNSTPVAERVCRSCSFPTGDAPVVEEILERVRLFIDERKLRAAEKALAEAREHEASWPKVGQTRAEVGRLTALYEKLGRHQKELEAKRHMVALSQSLRDNPETGPSPDYQDLRSAANRGAEAVKRADAFVAKGRLLASQGKLDEALDAFEAARLEAADNVGAAEGAQAVPLQPVSQVRSETLQAGVRLTWTSPTGRRKLTYRVVRQEGRAPKHPDDGTDLGETANAWLEDQSAPRGVPIYYGVTTCHGAARSRQMPISKPVLLQASVTNLTLKPADRQIQLQWTKPRGAHAVVLMRAVDGAGREPEQLLKGGQEQYVDAGLKNGVRVIYTIRAAYWQPDAPGKEILGPATQASSTPAIPPAPVLDMKARAVGADTVLEWTPPDRGQATPVAVFWSDLRPARVLEGETRSVADLADLLGQEIGDRLSPPPRRMRLPKGGRLVLTPVTINGAMATVGRSITLNRLDPVGKLEIVRDGNDLVLSWIWPAGVEQALIRTSETTAVMTAEETKGSRKQVDRASGETTARVRVRPVEGKLTHISVFAVYQGGVSSEPAVVRGRVGGETRVSYRITRRRRFLVLGPLTQIGLDIVADTDVELPALCLVLKRGSFPRDGSDGEAILEIPPCLLKGRLHTRYDINPKHWGLDNYVRLTFLGDQGGSGILLQQPNADLARLG